MATRSDNKLNRLQQELPEGLLADAAWMEAHGKPTDRPAFPPELRGAMREAIQQ